MDYLGATSTIFSIYQKVQALPLQKGGIGLYEYKYKMGEYFSFLTVILTKPEKEKTVKKKIFQKVIDKSKSREKPILPKYIKYIIPYVNNIFDNVSTPRSEVLERLKELLCGFRLQFYMYNNLKNTFKDQNNPQIIIHQENSTKGQYYCFIHAFEVKEDGLILAHERQIAYIKEQIEKGVNPIKLKQLPSLRTGDTVFNQPNKKDEDTIEEEEEEVLSPHVKHFKEKIKKKKNQKEIDKELEFQTVVSSYSEEKEEDKNIQNQNIIMNNSSPFGPTFSTIGKPDEKEEERDDINTKMVSHVHKINEIEEKYQKIQNSHHKLQKDYQALESMNIMLKNKLEHMEDENTLYKNQISDLTENLSKKLQDKEQKIDSLSQFKEANKILTTNIAKVSKENEKLKDKLEFLESEKIRLKDELENQKRVSISEMKKLDDTIEKLMQQLNESMNQFETLKNQKSQIKNKRTEDILVENQILAKAIKETDINYKTLLEDYKFLLEENENHLKNKKQQDDELESYVLGLEAENSKMRKEIRNLKSNMDESVN